MDVTEALKDYANQKAAKLIKYLDRISKIEVVFELVKEKPSVEIIVSVEHGGRFVASDMNEKNDAYASIDNCVDKLERQLHEHKDKFRNRKHLSGEDKHAK
jgi:putative sigma-54 modulation protein